MEINYLRGNSPTKANCVNREMEENAAYMSLLFLKAVNLSCVQAIMSIFYPFLIFWLINFFHFKSAKVIVNVCKYLNKNQNIE